MITHKQALEDTCMLIRQVKESTGLPISGLLCPTVMNGKDDMQKIKTAGADHVGIAIDAATPELFSKYRGKEVKGPHRWEVYWQAVADAVEVFGQYKAGVHLIVGLGETEKQMVDVISRAYKMGALTHLFSFYPEAGSRMEQHSQPPMGQYRRIQLARYLINNGVIKGNQIEYSEAGKIISFGVNIEPYIIDGRAFMTSGCPGKDGIVACNRPFANERVNQPIRNFPFVPEYDDTRAVYDQIFK